MSQTLKQTIVLRITVESDEAYEEVIGALEDVRDAGFPVTWEVS